MAQGLRLDPEDVDLDRFRVFLEDAGAVFASPHASGSEVLRFRVGQSFGIVSRRKDGRLTFAGYARPMFVKMNNGEPAPRPVKAALRTFTFHADRHGEVRPMLTGATKAEVHTDGSSTASGVGAGGWAATIRVGFDTIEIYGGARKTTVNRMELIAAIAALELLPATCAVKVFTDSQYVRRGITKWAARWRVNGWKTAAGQPVKSEDLWRRLLTLTDGRAVTWKWVRGHTGNRGNERADELARMGRMSIDKKPKGKAA